MKPWMTGLFLVCFLAACSSGTPDPQKKEPAKNDRATAIAALKGDTTKGKELFEGKCKFCHGSDGKGTGAGPDLVGHLDDHDNKELAGVILDGRGKMPAYKDEFQDQDIADTLAYIREVLGKK